MTSQSIGPRRRAAARVVGGSTLPASGAFDGGHVRALHPFQATVSGGLRSIRPAYLQLAALPPFQVLDGDALTKQLEADPNLRSRLHRVYQLIDRIWDAGTASSSCLRVDQVEPDWVELVACVPGSGETAVDASRLRMFWRADAVAEGPWPSERGTRRMVRVTVSNHP